MSTQQVLDPATRAYRTTNPATGQVLQVWDRLPDDQAAAFLTRAHDGFLSWREVPRALRAACLRRVADLIDGHTEDFARLVTSEMGKPYPQSVHGVGLASSMLRYYAEHGETWLADEDITIPGFSRTVIRREPMGVVLGIEPWNGPQYMAMRVAAPNLMLGNTVLIKPHEITAGSTLLFDELFVEAGFPVGVYQTAMLSTNQVSTMIADPRVRAVTLTGSDRAGSAVAEQAGRHLKPVVLELGGSDAFIVLDSADPVSAATTAASCRLVEAGQVCVSPKRVIVTEKNADRFIEHYAEHFRAQHVGDPFDPATTIGPLSSRAAVETLHGQLQDAIDKGATVVVPGGPIEGPGAFFAPAVLTEVTPEMRLYSEEAFGPVAVIYRVPDATAAVELANSSKYGLGGTVLGHTGEAESVARQLDIGMVGINTWFGGPIEAPFGGTKSSGFGRELGGRAGMDQFANIKTYGFV